MWGEVKDYSRDGKGFGRAVSRILSAALRPERIIYLSGLPGTQPACADTGASRALVPNWTLLPMGFAVPPRLRLGRCALTAPFHPGRQLPGGGLSLCGTVRRRAFRRTARVYLRPNRSYAASRSVEFGLSSRGKPRAILRPSEAAETVMQQLRRSKAGARAQEIRQSRNRRERVGHDTGSAPAQRARSSAMPDDQREPVGRRQLPAPRQGQLVAGAQGT